MLLRLLSRATRGNHLSDSYGRFVMVEALGANAPQRKEVLEICTAANSSGSSSAETMQSHPAQIPPLNVTSNRIELGCRSGIMHAVQRRKAKT